MATLHKNINKLQAQVYEGDDDNGPVPNNIPKLETQRDKSTYKRWGWDGIDQIKSSGYCYERDGLSGFGK